MENTPEILCNSWCLKHEQNTEIHLTVAPLLYPSLTAILSEFDDTNKLSWVPDEFKSTQQYLLSQAEYQYLTMIKTYTALKEIKDTVKLL